MITFAPPRDPAARAAAYRQPWRLQRADPAHPVMMNGGDEALDFVRVFHDARGQEQTLLHGSVAPGEQIGLCLCDADLDEVVVTVAWFRPCDGLEYLWRFVV